MLLQMKFHDGMNFHSISQLLNHCTRTKNLRAVKAFHAHVVTSGLSFVSPNLQTKLLFTYTECIDGEKSHKILSNFLNCLSLRNPIPFNSIISHFSQRGFDCFSLRTLRFMHSNSVYVDSYSLCSSIKSASCLKRIWFGKVMQAYVKKSGWLSSVFVGSALVDFYAKLLCTNDAANVFDEIPVKNTVCVNALMSAYADAKMWSHVIELIRRMPLLSLTPDNFTLSAALRACCGVCALESGKQVHANVIRRMMDVEGDVFLQSLMIEMYGKCGRLGSAKRIFNIVGYSGGGEGRRKDVILWTSILGVCGRAGDYIEVMKLFRDMIMEGVTPDGVAFLTVISACGHAGQVDLGLEYFESMIRDYGLIASREHYSCVVDLLCRAGKFERACKFVAEMPDSGEESCAVSMWGALLSACVTSGNVNFGKLAAQRALELDPTNVGIYILLSNLYATNGMWTEIEQLRELMKKRGLKKDLGWSSIGAPIPISSG
ncbi:putative pentatricopeptide repeat-containing protein At3g13770, mitochondrial [Andrographis paniculata]|uniref:putative pentatricopeptide repeat-containing protein At3g13770, mitochondrial n=1 Tax=Andrographis paniculata TaxID=175694 RepID=UPI0021E90832|nr:putative pentatricopeptide repeat-containing protein At3g13770, mitochondrial [Andrographis paniculata]